MNAQDVIKSAAALADSIWKRYLADLADGDLLVRPVPGANHILWQLGHLIVSTHGLIEAVVPGSMPPLPEGFVDRYTVETSKLDDPQAFHTKDELLALADRNRRAMLAALERQSAADLDAPSPERLRQFGPTVGAIFAMEPGHWLLHAGQWAVIRRKLGKPPLF